MSASLENDRQARREALNPSRSFIVQAPAGSGKTTLLVQRILVLLSQVNQPEEIVAITFTRKAAAEMRTRVLDALLRASNGDVPNDGVARATHDLALAALRRNQERGWDLDRNPQRLNIDTIDALNLWLAERLPLLSGGVAGARIVEDATAYYRRAALAAMTRIAGTEQQSSLRTLLGGLKNRVDALQDLVAGMLPTRDQWLGHLMPDRSFDGLREELEKAISLLIAHHLGALKATLQATDQAQALMEVVGRVALLGREEPGWDAWLRDRGLPDDTAEGLLAWQNLANLLLTRGGKWRQRLTKKEGFGPEEADLRERLLEIIGQFRTNEGLREQLAGAAKLPNPKYDSVQWNTLLALRHVLLESAAELKVQFLERGTCDFVELGMAARSALGRLDAPTDLMLALDHRIQHILVDEFQDTSSGQYLLLDQLTSGWEPGDGRTVFLVGDPMQSIYRFRDADLGLFLNARTHGLKTVPLVPLTLSCNFRSDAQLVEWVNKVIGPLMPAIEDGDAGAAAFVESQPTRGRNGAQRVTVCASPSQEGEIQNVAILIKDQVERFPGHTIGVLVHNRKHARGLQEALRGRGVPATAVEIEPLSRRPHVHLLIALTRALLHRGDRLAWLTVLRAPWCGATLQDLLALCEGVDADVWSCLTASGPLSQISEDGRYRLARVVGAFEDAFRLAAEQPISFLVEQLWERLGGSVALGEAEIEDVRQFLGRLAEHERDGALDDPSNLDQLFSQPFGLGPVTGNTSVEIMTIHKAKGLEFDTVFVIGLGQRGVVDDQKGLRWWEANLNGERRLLLAPFDGSGGYAKDPLLSFLRREDRRRDELERLRLLYVAFTRAKSQLFLTGLLADPDDLPQAGSVFRKIWEGIAPGLVYDTREVQDTPTVMMHPPSLKRLSSDWLKEHPIVGLADASPQASGPEFEWVSQIAVHVGTIVHEWLMRIFRDGLAQWDSSAIEAREPFFVKQLQLVGAQGPTLQRGVSRVKTALLRTLEDQKGRWLLSEHEDDGAELSLTAWGPDGLENLVIDRTFVDDGIRWIVDYKTSSHEGGDINEFVDAEIQRYRPQLLRYAKAVEKLDSRPIRVGLYFPLLQRFVSWDPGLERTGQLESSTSIGGGAAQ